uniref:Uncharacterized protein n=1 Tax=Anguilla anguilla TaxID=7936 RepID=A0A0E9V9F1_ANGAN
MEVHCLMSIRLEIAPLICLFRLPGWTRVEQPATTAWSTACTATGTASPPLTATPLCGQTRSPNILFFLYKDTNGEAITGQHWCGLDLISDLGAHPHQNGALTG